jgi:aminopeptidase N
MIGSRRNVRNDSPIIGPYGVNQDGSGDMYYKGGNMLHMMRQLVDNDEKWRGVLRGLSNTFWHQTVTTEQVEQFMSREAGIDFSKIFDGYLRTKNLPTLEYRIANGALSYRWVDVVPGFHMDVKATVTAGLYTWLHPTETWQSVPSPVTPTEFTIDENFYVRSKNVGN